MAKTAPIELKPSCLVMHPLNGVVLEFDEYPGVDQFCVTLGGEAGFLEFKRVTDSFRECFQSSRWISCPGQGRSPLASIPSVLWPRHREL